MTKPPRKKSQPLLRETDLPIRSRPLKIRDPAQPQLPFDPRPDRIEPCLALLKAKPPSGPDWIYEIKWDGYRIAVHIEPNSVRIITRGGHDWTERFPAIAAAARKLGVGTAILDGEAVVLDAEGRSDFGALQRSLGGRGGKKSSKDAILYAFDLLYFDGHDLTKMELSGRRHLLEDLIGESEGTIRVSQEVEADGATLLAAAREHGLEGIIAKHRDSTYRSGRLGDWLKIKCIQSESFVVVGYEPSTAARGGIGSLLLGAYQGDAFIYVGSVGTGFKEKDAIELRRMLDTLKIRRAAVAVDKKGVVFVQPTLIAEIEYRAWTDDGKLRHASYKGLRDVQDNAAIYKLPE
ncbi:MULTISPECIES: non-homologous end-joining DNA ligase [Rhizobium/Agrobacterium group]|uniref:non-homologous end-joining DNA ligase n=1 Tax=Rhizobium/Agrobacterium group TaxID=227290 RepID=UPI0015748DF8|nr:MULTISPECIES: non-homologous end-joining DNA ligase [Rhizobium/Agrobacterium group]NTC82532.1 ATP-dependent DNA ligase [Agrobacterium tumefaciens]NTD11355.1 ATP-dependent DNA ligase [Agrobacterium tumefaciens]NTD85711.1 ATP-dependent DNA ligase [Agrobacterium tumefaciens]NTD93984.1 ATP-dependent DNA ligase [Agrobacterium tumefaciens]NTD97135.1 ATP-dependent DNA ligase [Agrobacterium tumefaciens]